MRKLRIRIYKTFKGYSYYESTNQPIFNVIRGIDKLHLANFHTKSGVLYYN